MQGASGGSCHLLWGYGAGVLSGRRAARATTCRPPRCLGKSSTDVLPGMHLSVELHCTRPLPVPQPWGACGVSNDRQGSRTAGAMPAALDVAGICVACMPTRHAARCWATAAVCAWAQAAVDAPATQLVPLAQLQKSKKAVGDVHKICAELLLRNPDLHQQT